MKQDGEFKNTQISKFTDKVLENQVLGLDKYKLGWHDVEDYIVKPQKGLSEDVVKDISKYKQEPQWMLDFRLKSLRIFNSKPLAPWFAPYVESLDFSDIYYYIKPVENVVNRWEDLPIGMRDTWDKLGIPQAERSYLAGVAAQYESEVVYHRNREDLEAQGVLFCDMDTALADYPDLVKKYFAKNIPPADNKFAALNSAVWSGGSFIYVPEGVNVDLPLQAYFRINSENMGQFERTLIIAAPGSSVHYVEGCSAPVYSSNSLHSAVVELVALEGAKIQYSTVQNWSNNVFNLVTKRAKAYSDARVSWIDGNIGSRMTIKYPSVYLMGPKASGEVLSVAYAGRGQTQDTGAKMYHIAPDTTSIINAKSVSKDGGVTTYRGLVKIEEEANNAKSFVRCDAMLLDEISESRTHPYMEINNSTAMVAHEASVSKVGEDQLFYLNTRGLSTQEATSLIVNGFLEPVTRELPLEYAVEWNRLIELQIEDPIG